MSLTPDQIIDRMRIKRKLSNWRAAAIVAMIILLISFFADSPNNSVSPVLGQDYIARVYVDGVIYDDIHRVKALKKLAEDKAAKGLIIHMNSPGGTVVGGENLHMAVRKVAQQMPVAVVMGDMAASAGYMVSIGGDYLVAHKGTVTGSIGVIAQSFELVDLAEKVGVKFHNFKSSPLKGGPIPTERLSPEMQQAMQETINDLYDMFVTMVAERRNFDASYAKSLANGNVYTGRQALEKKLIDALGDEDTAYDWIVQQGNLGTSVKIRDYRTEEYQNSIDKLFNSISSISNTLKLLFNNDLQYFS